MEYHDNENTNHFFDMLAQLDYVIQKEMKEEKKQVVILIKMIFQ
jgi:hypothetical protein